MPALDGIAADIAEADDFTLQQCLTVLAAISNWPLMDRHTSALEAMIVEKFGVTPMMRRRR
jgi:hypothetical protein